jgi:hypothetical protein
MMALSLSMVALLTVVSVQRSGAQAGYLQEEPARLYLTPEIFSYGGRAGPSTDNGDFTAFRIASVDLKYWRLRAGTSLVEAGYSSGSLSVLPVRLGFTIWERPRRYLWKLYGMAPEFYLQTTATLWPVNGDLPPHDEFVGHAEVRAAADIFGVGLDVGAGVAAVYGSSFNSTPYKWTVHPAIDARLELGVTNFGF